MRDSVLGPGRIRELGVREPRGGNRPFSPQPHFVVFDPDTGLLKHAGQSCGSDVKATKMRKMTVGVKMQGHALTLCNTQGHALTLCSLRVML